MNTSFEFYKIDVVEIEVGNGISLTIDMCELEQTFLQEYVIL